jgi:hypothetical protein
LWVVLAAVALVMRKRGGRSVRQTGLVAHLDLDGVREALRSGRPEALIGLRECKWLDAKREPHKLGHPKQDAELLKDAVALANARGGVLAVGFETTKGGRRRGRNRPVADRGRTS